MQDNAPSFWELMENGTELEGIIYYNIDLKQAREWRDTAKARIQELNESAKQRQEAFKTRHKNFEQITFTNKGYTK